MCSLLICFCFFLCNILKIQSWKQTVTGRKITLILWICPLCRENTRLLCFSLKLCFGSNKESCSTFNILMKGFAFIKKQQVETAYCKILRNRDKRFSSHIVSSRNTNIINNCACSSFLMRVHWSWKQFSDYIYLYTVHSRAYC